MLEIVSNYYTIYKDLIYIFYAGLETSSNITIEGETRVVFFFGPRVLIPDDNELIDDEQCFEIGLDCTVPDIPSLVEGRLITFEAIVETDNNVRTRTAIISPVVS